MPIKSFIVDKVDDSRTADVLKSGALETSSVYTYAYINSGTASGMIASAPAYLHGVTVTVSGGPGLLYIGDVLTGTINNSTSANVVSLIDLSARGSYLFDVYCSSGIGYRLSGLNNNGITVSYQLA
jgi:hypothetical protein